MIDIADTLRRTTARMASYASSVPMWLWQEHSTATLQAADTISALTAERDALLAALAEAVDALKPFASRADEFDHESDVRHVTVKIGDLRRARDVVRKVKA